MALYLQVYTRYISSGKLKLCTHASKRKAGGQDVALMNWSRKVVWANCMACPQQQYENACWRKATIGGYKLLTGRPSVPKKERSFYKSLRGRK